MTLLAVEPAVATPEEARVPVLSLSRKSPLRTDPAAMDAYYANRRLMWRNLILIGTAMIGWNISIQLVTPLMAVRLLDLGVRQNVQGTISAANFVAISFLVMLFSWISDHTISRFGRRKPYLYIAAPFIIAMVVLFPFIAAARTVWLLLVMQVVYLLFMDLKNSTFALVQVDCMPRAILARTFAALNVFGGLVGFVVNRNAGALIALGEWVPYVVAGGVMLLTTIAAGMIVEPPIFNPRTEAFKPWSTFKVTAQDKRTFVLIVGMALMMGWMVTYNQWLWFWSKESLGLSRGAVFEAISWAGLLNVVLAYPLGWVIDRCGGLRVVVVYWILCVGCFLILLNVHDKSGLALLAMLQTITVPMYWSFDIMVYRASPPKDIGSVSATSSCIRNALQGLIVLATGWTISWCAGDYRVGFAMGLACSTVGLLFFFIHHWMMRSPARAASITTPVQVLSS
jgi:MFS family permease